MLEKPRSFEELCLRDVGYIRAHYGQTMNPEQKRSLDKLEALTRELIKFIKLKLSDSQVARMFSSNRKQLKAFRKQIENEWKYSKTDYDAWTTKASRTGEGLIEIMDLVKITRLQKSPLTLEDVKDVNFPTLGYQNRELAGLASMIFKNTGFYKTQNFPASKIDSLSARISKNYNVASYHNFSHGFSVFLMCYQVYLISPEIRLFLNDFQLFCLLLGSLSHDLNHKGRNNMYEIQRKSSLAVDYSNQSVLENMHISTLFSILNEPEVDILSSIKDPLLRQRAKRVLSRCILATDMAKHFSSAGKFKQKRLATQQSKLSPNALNEYLCFQPKRQEDREIVLQYTVHACDISNPCLAYDNYITWAALLSHEFNQQYKRQEAKGFQVTPFLKYVDRTTFYKGQVGFADNIVAPLWKQLTLFSGSLAPFYDQLMKNIEELKTKQ